MSAKLGSSITAIGTVKASVRPSSGVSTIQGCLSIEEGQSGLQNCPLYCPLSGVHCIFMDFICTHKTLDISVPFSWWSIDGECCSETVCLMPRAIREVGEQA